MARPLWQKVVFGTLALSGASILLCAGIFGPCWRSWLLDGMLVQQCPTGKVLPTLRVSAEGVGRGHVGTVSLHVDGSYVVGSSSAVRGAPIRRFGSDLELIFPDGTSRPLEAKGGWSWDSGYAKTATVNLPDVPDGTYQIRAKAHSPVGDVTAEAPIRLYAPALIHTLTDSPLYKQGQSIRFRSVVMREQDLTPLEGRPGVWTVLDPNGEVVLEEKAKGGPFGIAASSFPLDDDAPLGLWTIRYQSGDDQDQVQVEVKPFTLPRFTVELTPSAGAFFPGDVASVRGKVLYTSGAPVANAPVSLTVSATGDWPPPLDWVAPRELTTNAQGEFSLEFGRVPADLLKQATLSLSARATDPTGETLYGGTSLLLSADRIGAEAVTELGDGLVPSTNNRVFLRVTTADGQPLVNSSVRLRKTWDAGDEGVVATTDADGVARLQVDPGQPVTIVDPVPPQRRRPRAQREVVQFNRAEERLRGESLNVEDQRTLDRWREKLKGCATYVVGGSVSTEVGVLVDPSGAVRKVVAQSEDPHDRCIERVLASEHAFSGSWRLYDLSLELEDPKTPSVDPSYSTLTGNSPDWTPMTDALLAARSCVATLQEGGALPQSWVWTLEKGSRTINWTPVPAGPSVIPVSAAACIESSFRNLSLPEPAEAAGIGTFSLSVTVPVDPSDQPRQPTTWQGFQYTVSAIATNGEERGTTLLNLHPGEVPDLRLRFSEVLVDPGQKVDLTAVRGPNYQGSFPEKMYLSWHGPMEKDGSSSHSLEFAFDPEKRIGSFTVPETARGYATVSWNNTQALLYVRPAATLQLSLHSEDHFKPGDVANLTVESRDRNGPVPAGVTLSGVDSTLATLATLPAADDFARVTVRAKGERPAFNVLNAQALETGQIRGDNAAQATILRISQTPPEVPTSEYVGGDGQSSLDIDGTLADAFYELYAVARTKVRGWEESAPKGEVMTPKKMMALWEEALQEHPAADAFGRPLHLSQLPPNLLTLTDPRFMVADGIRLPEDVENWPAFVAKEAR